MTEAFYYSLRGSSMKNSELSTSMSLAGVADMDQAGVDGKIICILLHTRFPVMYYIGRCRTYERGLPLLVNRGLRAESGCRPALPPSKPLAPRSSLPPRFPSEARFVCAHCLLSCRFRLVAGSASVGWLVGASGCQQVS